MADDKPYLAEYAKSNRASCKKCKEKIDKGELRLAVMVQTAQVEQKIPNWFHFLCFKTRAKVACSSEIGHFESLRWEDQKKIEEKIINGKSEEPSTSKKGAKSAKKKVSTGQSDFSVEYAKSARATCPVCDIKHTKGGIRISKLDYTSDSAKRFGPLPRWHHPRCFSGMRVTLEFFESASSIPGFDKLTDEDQAELNKLLPKIERPQKRPLETEDGESSTKSKKAKLDNSKEDKEEQALKKQNQLLYKYRDQLQSQLKKAELQELLVYNDQKIPSGEAALLDCLSDCLAFGCPLPCTECEGGQLRYKSGGYFCTGDLTSWTKCQYFVKKPERKPFVVPQDFQVYNFLSSYAYKKRDRLISKKETLSVPKPDSPKTLTNFNFFILGKEIDDVVMRCKIQTLGGKVISTLDRSVLAVVSTKEDVAKKSSKMKKVKALGLHVVSEDFLKDLDEGKGLVESLTSRCICNWAEDAQQKIDIVKTISTVKESAFEKVETSTKKVTLKAGSTEVDPDSGLSERAHVYSKGSNGYNAILGLVNITKGQNSFYKLQVLQANNSKETWLFRAWGRIGTTIGGNKLETFDSPEDAIEAFETLYFEKSGNLWSSRHNFVKQPGRLYPIDIDYGPDEDELMKNKVLKPGVNSKLDKAVQDLMCLIFDIDSMKKAMLEFEIDLKKMPLGKLSKKQIEKAYKVLTELQELIRSGEKTESARYLDCSNRFYTLIPHNFGMKMPPILNTEDQIKMKIQMLESLLEIEIAYSLLQETDSTTKKDPIDQHYEQLKTDIQVLDTASNEFNLIKSYVENTHAATHSSYTLELENVFKVKRSGEESRYKPFKKLHNRKLLWHGSRVTNYVGILSQGLRIAPPEAPSTGYMFGKGIYFADMVSKSANYCSTSRSNNTGLLLLCEVALGNMYERATSDYITKLPTSKHSTKGVGSTCPDPAQSHILEDGVEIPLGKPKQNLLDRSSLLYNEYIVYDVAQANIKYLLKVKFNYRR